MKMRMQSKQLISLGFHEICYHSDAVMFGAISCLRHKCLADINDFHILLGAKNLLSFYLRTVSDATTVYAVNCTWTPKLFGNHPSAHFQALCIPVIQGHGLINTQKAV